MSEAVQARPGLPHEVDPREFDGAGIQRDPFPLYRRLRDHHPVYHDRFHNRWALTRYWDIDGAFQDNENYDRAVYRPDGPYEFGSTHVFGPNILEYGNSPRHRWLRNIVAGQFVGTRLQDFLRMIEQICDEVMAKFTYRGHPVGAIALEKAEIHIGVRPERGHLTVVVQPVLGAPVAVDDLLAGFLVKQFLKFRVHPTSLSEYKKAAYW